MDTARVAPAFTVAPMVARSAAESTPRTASTGPASGPPVEDPATDPARPQTPMGARRTAARSARRGSRPAHLGIAGPLSHRSARYIAPPAPPVPAAALACAACAPAPSGSRSGRVRRGHGFVASGRRVLSFEPGGRRHPQATQRPPLCRASWPRKRPPQRWPTRASPANHGDAHRPRGGHEHGPRRKAPPPPWPKPPRAACWPLSRIWLSRASLSTARWTANSPWRKARLPPCPPASTYATSWSRPNSTTPTTSARGAWDYGFLFRHTGLNNEYRLVVNSTGHWGLGLTEVEPVPIPGTARPRYLA